MKIKREIASILIIGNEILSGKTQDTNSNYIARKLYAIGVRCEEINVVADNHEMIILKINELRKKYDYVFTTGGIGPTHDDITAFAISKALNLPYVINPIANKKLEDHYSDEEFTKARQKMAYMPKGAKLIDNPVSVAPGFNVKNIYVFPGVPKILEVMLDEFIKSIKKKNKFFKKQFQLPSRRV